MVINNYYFLFFLIVLPFYYYIYFYFRRNFKFITKKKIIIFFIRIVLFILIILSLCNIKIKKVCKKVNITFVLDISNSIPSKIKREALFFLKNIIKKYDSTDIKFTLIVFGKEPSIEFYYKSGKELKNFEKLYANINQTQTNIKKALKIALITCKDTNYNRVILLSDGNETIGKALKCIKKYIDSYIPIDVIPLPINQQDNPEVILKKIIIPKEVYINQNIPIYLLIKSNIKTRGKIILELNNNLYSSQEVFIEKGKNLVKFLIRSFKKERLIKLKAFLKAKKDTLVYNNIKEELINIQSNRKLILYIYNPEKNINYLYNILKVNSFYKVTLLNYKNISTNLLKFLKYHLIIFDNVPAYNLSQRQMEIIETVVKENGVGFLMIGGENSFGVGGYTNTPIERILPVKCEVTSKKVNLNGALVLVLHTCEIPVGNYWAKIISKKTVEVLSPIDLLGILYYDWEEGEKWLFNLTYVKNKNKIYSLIDKIMPSDMPNFHSILKMAYDSLKKVKASQKHIILISDGDPSPPSISLLKKMKKEKISLSTAIIFPHNNSSILDKMKYISLFTGGRFYYVKDVKKLSKIFQREALKIRKNLIQESKKGFNIIINDYSPILKNISTKFPKIYGYILTSPKPLAFLPLIIKRDKEYNPLVAYWQVGLGKSGCFTSDIKNRWGKDWLKWKDNVKFWINYIESLSKKRNKQNFVITYNFNKGKIDIIIDALDKNGKFINFLELKGTAVNIKTLEKISFNFYQKDNGRYKGTFTPKTQGSFIISIKYKGKDIRGNITKIITFSNLDEYAKNKINYFLLERIAYLTKGKLLSYNLLKKNFDKIIKIDNIKKRYDYISLTPLFIKIFLILFLLEIFLNKVKLDLFSLFKYFNFNKNRRKEIKNKHKVYKNLKSHIKDLGISKKVENIDINVLIDNIKKENLRNKEKEDKKTITNKISSKDIYIKRLLQAKKNALNKGNKKDEN